MVVLNLGSRPPRLRSYLPSLAAWLLVRGDHVSVVSLARRAGHRQWGVRASLTGRTGRCHRELTGRTPGVYLLLS